MEDLPARPFLIGVAGGSSSGKTTVAERLAELAGERHLALIKLDSYYVDLSDRPLEERQAFNYDHPDAFDWPLLNDHLAALSAGASVPVPLYDYVLHNRSGRTRIVHPARDRRRRGDPRALGTDRCGNGSTSRCTSTPTPTSA